MLLFETRPLIYFNKQNPNEYRYLLFKFFLFILVCLLFVFNNYDLGRGYESVANETEMDLGDDHIIPTAQQLITFTKSFVIL